MNAVAYYNYGRWVVYCPGEGCTNAMAAGRGQEQFACLFTNGAGHVDGCGTTAPIDWPADVAAIEASVAGMQESSQNWEPDVA